MKTRSSARLAAKKNSGGAQTNYRDRAAKKKSKHAQKNYMTRAAKKKRGHVQANYMDRLSSLPDPVLQHILSFLTSRNAVQTCVVSKRWRNLWTSVPSLVLDLGEFGDNGKKCQNHLVDFVDKLLLYRDRSDVDRFHLYCNAQRCHCDRENERYSDCSHMVLNLYPHVNKWIHYAVGRNVKELKISLFYEYVKPRFHIPKCIFTCQSLENLNLEFDTNPRVVLKSPKSIVLSQLKSLHLDQFYIHDMSKILSSCPLLEELYLRDCNLKNPFITSDTVKSLSLIDCWTDWSRIWINIPSLTSLSLCCDDCHCPEIKSGVLSSLETACVSEYRAFRFRDTYAGVYLVRELSAAEELNLSASWIKVIPKSDISQFPTLHNLKRLTLGGWQISDDFHVVALFLVHSPNLEMLTLIDEDAKSEVNKDARWDAPIMFFNCPKLKTVEIRISSRNGRYLQLVDFLLANGKGLNEIIIKKSWP